MDKRIKFIGFIPNIINCCMFVPDKYKTHNCRTNKILQSTITPLILGALFFSNVLPLFSTELIAGGVAIHIIGQIVEGILS